MRKSEFSKSRRVFLEQLKSSAGASVLLRAAAVLGIGSNAIGCGGSSNASPSPTTPPTAQVNVPRPGDWPDEVGTNTSVVVLGGGIAGMCAAYEMQRLGFSVTIIEASASAGGRCRTLRAGDTVTEIDSEQVCTFDPDDSFYFNSGPARIPHHHEFILGYCKSFGIALEPFINFNSSSLFHSSQAFAGTPQVARRVIHDVRGYIGELLAEAIQSGALASQLSGIDSNGLLNLVQVFADLDQNFDYQGSERSGFLGQENSGSRARFTQLNPIELEQLLASNFWQFQLDFTQSLNQQATMLQPVGGMDNIARAFEQRVAQNLLTNCQVQRIENTAQGVLIEYLDEFQAVNSINADFAICTIPATVLRNINHNFSSQHASIIQQFEYTQSGKLAFQSPRFWESQHNIYGGISWTNQAITQMWYPSGNLGSDNGIIVGAYTFDDNSGQTFASLSPSERIDWASQQGAALHIDYLNSVSRGISVSWPKVPWQLGAWGRSQPGILTTPDNNVMFAGEHVSQLQGWQEGAVMSAYQAIDLIVQRISG